ncbi:MAG: alpha/beta hydrolase [Candidatus Aminicenantales bacterium]
MARELSLDWGVLEPLQTEKSLEGQIQCPVVAIHGDFDSHPAEGVEKPLSAVLKSFRLIRLKNCGHMPWIERQAKDQFYKILKEELQS